MHTDSVQVRRGPNSGVVPFNDVLWTGSLMNGAKAYVSFMSCTSFTVQTGRKFGSEVHLPTCGGM